MLETRFPRPPDSRHSMSSNDYITAEQFVEHRLEFPDGGRWAELASGRVITLSPPTAEHGTVVLNLSKSLANYTQREKRGYACFNLGFLLEREPDTLRFPPISFFTIGRMFTETDRVFTDSRPQLVVEIASTSDRRRGLDERVSEWLKWGAKMVWVIDPDSRQAHSFESHRSGQRLFEEQTLIGGAGMLGFAITVGDLFLEPKWATKPPIPQPSTN